MKANKELERILKDQLQGKVQWEEWWDSRVSSLYSFEVFIGFLNWKLSCFNPEQQEHSLRHSYSTLKMLA